MSPGALEIPSAACRACIALIGSGFNEQPRPLLLTRIAVGAKGWGRTDFRQCSQAHTDNADKKSALICNVWRSTPLQNTICSSLISCTPPGLLEQKWLVLPVTQSSGYLRSYYHHWIFSMHKRPAQKAKLMTGSTYWNSIDAPLVTFCWRIIAPLNLSE